MHTVIPPTTSEITHHTCNFHKKHPGSQFPGCTCSSSYTTKTKPMAEWTEEERSRHFAALRGERPDGTPLY